MKLTVMGIPDPWWPVGSAIQLQNCNEWFYDADHISLLCHYSWITKVPPYLLIKVIYHWNKVWNNINTDYLLDSKIDVTFRLRNLFYSIS